MESVFSRFESYDFAANQRFQDGLKTLPDSDISGDGTKLLDMKLFFYNRYVTCAASLSDPLITYLSVNCEKL